MTSQHKTGTAPFYIGMYIHIYTHIYVHIYTSQKECLHIFQCICATGLCKKFPDSPSPLSPALRPGLVPMVLEELLSARAKAKKELKQAAASGGHAL